MMNPNEIRKNIFADLITRDNAHNGYYKKLGIEEKIESSWDSNLWVLDKLKNNVDIADNLITKYMSEGNDLNNELAFKKLSVDVDSIFKPKGFFSFFK